MRIAYLINQYPKISHTFIRREIRALERAGVEIMRISLRGWDAHLVDPDDLAERQKTWYVLHSGALSLLMSVLRIALGRPILFVRALALTFRMGWRAERPLPVHFVYLAEACLICRWLQSEKVQHLHAHFGTNSAEVAMLAHELGGSPWSFTVHGPEEFDKPFQIGLSEKIRRATFVVAVSSFGRGQLFRFAEFGHWNKIFVVHCGLEPEYFSHVSEVNGSNELICVGRLCAQKGQLLLVEAARRLTDRGRSIRLTLAGDGELRPAIEKLIDNYGLHRQIHIAGWMSGDEVRRRIIGARALILPSFAEGLPVVLMEAMALRRPAISTYVAGIPELLGTTGWLVPAGDLDALVETIEDCLNSELDELRVRGDRAHLIVAERHNLEIEIVKLADLFTASTNGSLSGSVS